MTAPVVLSWPSKGRLYMKYSRLFGKGPKVANLCTGKLSEWFCVRVHRLTNLPTSLAAFLRFRGHFMQSVTESWRWKPYGRPKSLIAMAVARLG